MQKINKPIHRIRAVVLGMLAVTGVMAGIAQAQADQAPSTPSIMRLVPKDAQLVMVVSNLSNLSQKVGSLESAWNLPEGSDLGGWLDQVKSEMGIEAGLNDEGSAMIVIPDLAMAGMIGHDERAENPDAPVLIMLPVSDYQAFLSNFEKDSDDAGSDETNQPNAQASANNESDQSDHGIKGDANLTKLRIKDEPGYVKHQGRYAVMGQLQSMVRNYQPGDDASAKAMMAKVGKAGQKVLGESDVMAYLDMAALQQTLEPMLDSALNQAEKQLDRRAEMGADAQQVKQQKMWMEMGGHLSRAIVRDTAAIVAGLDIGDNGAGMRLAAQFKPDSTLGKFFPGAQADLGKLLARLPDKPYIMAGAIDGKAIDMDAITDEVLEELPKESSNPMVKMYRKQLPMVKKIDGWAWSWYTVDAQAAQSGGLLNMLYVYKIDGEPAKILDQYKKAFKQLNQQKMAMGAGNEMSIVSEYTEDALEIEGVSVDQYNFQMVLPQEVMRQMGPAIMMMGGLGYNGFMAVKDDNVVMTTTQNLQLITAAIKGLEKQQGLGSNGSLDGLRKEHLPEHLAGEMYISASGLGQTANSFLQGFGMPPVNVSDETPPVAIGLGVNQGAIAGRLFLPNQTVKTISQEAQRMRKQAHNRGQGGPGGPGGPQGQPDQGPAAPQ